VVLALRNPVVRKPRGGSFRWSDGAGGVVFVNEFFGAPEPPPDPEAGGAYYRRFATLRRAR